MSPTRQRDYTQTGAGSIRGPETDRPRQPAGSVGTVARADVSVRPVQTAAPPGCQDRRRSRWMRADSCMLMFVLQATSSYLLSLDIARHSWTEQLRSARSAYRLHPLHTGRTPSHHARPRCLSLCALWVKHVSTWEQGGGAGWAGQAKQRSAAREQPARNLSHQWRINLALVRHWWGELISMPIIKFHFGEATLCVLSVKSLQQLGWIDMVTVPEICWMSETTQSLSYKAHSKL